MGEDGALNVVQSVAEIVSRFISAIDMLALEMFSIDSVAPAVKDICNSLK